MEDAARLDLRFTLVEASPRVSALAAARLAALGLLADEPGRPEPAVRAVVDPQAVVDVRALREAALAAAASGRVTHHPALDIDGTSRGTAVSLVPRGAAGGTASGAPLGTWLPRADPCVPPAGPVQAVIYGIFREATGYAAVGRNLVVGLAARGIPVAAKTAWWPEVAQAGLPSAELALIERAGELAADPALPSLLLRPAGDASGSPSVSEFAATRLTGAVCAATMFECEGVPGRWVRALQEYDQVWVPSSFNQRTFAQAGVPAELLRLVPIGIDAPTFSPDGPQLTLPNRRRVAFLSVFDWNERKGPYVLLRAWARAFGPDDDVVLYLRTGSSSVGARGGPLDEIRSLGLDPAALAPIQILTESLPLDAYAALFRSVDAFILTSRGEAFCIPLLEAMACGVPAIGTGYGGSTDFLDESTGFPIPARLVPVARRLSGRVPFYAGQRWADPSVEATAEALRRVVDDPAETRRRTAHAFARAQLAFDRRVTARVAERALAEARPRGPIHTAGRALLIAPLRDASRAGRAGRALFDALARTDATPRVQVSGAHDADLDPIEGRRIRRAERLALEPREALVCVDAYRPDASAVLLTGMPEDVSVVGPRAGIWTDDAAVATGLRERGIAPERVHQVRLPVDVTLWTPDARASDIAACTIYVAPEPNRIAALAAFARLVQPEEAITLLLAGLPEAPVTPQRIDGELDAAMKLAGIPRWNPRILALPYPPTSRHAIPMLATATIAFAADPDWPEHELVRACGVPVLALDDLVRARLLLSDLLERDREGIVTRRAAVARARTDAEALRALFDEVAALAPVARFPRPLRIAAVIEPDVPEPARVLAELRSHALHEIVGVDGDLRRLDYVVRVSAAVEVALGWDEVLVNALESRGVAVAESFEWSALAAELPDSTFEQLQTNAVLARNCEAGARAPVASGALQMVRATDATAKGPVWRSVACIVRPLAARVPA